MNYLWCNDPISAAEACRSYYGDYVSEQIALADSATDNTFIFTDHYEMERCSTPVHFDKDIDWNANPFGDPEWTFAFNRHTFLGHLARAFVFTRDAKYKDAWERLFLDFAQNSELNERSENASWRSLECGIRIENWLRSVELFSYTSPLGTSVIAELERLLSVHKERLLACRTPFHRLSNWGILQDHGLFLIACYFHDTELMDLCVRRLDESFDLQTFRDGTHWEQSPMYQTEVLHCGLDVLLTSRRMAYELPERLLANLHRLSLGLARISRPDGYCFLYGDSDEIGIRDLFARASLLFQDSELSYFSNGEVGSEFYWDFPVFSRLPSPKKPDSLSFIFPDSGNAVIRTGQDSAVRFHAGLYGSGHGHIDQLSFDLYSRGTVLITDGGRGTYLDSPWRRDLKGGKGHNTILVDGEDMSVMNGSWGIENFAEPLLGIPSVSDRYSFLEAMHTGYFSLGVLVKRRLITIEDRAVIVVDEVNANGAHDVSAYFHLDDSLSVQLDGNRLHAKNRSSDLWIELPREGSPLLGSYPLSKHYNERVESPLLSYTASVEGFSSFVTLITYGDLEKAPVWRECEVKKSLSGAKVPATFARGGCLEIDDDLYRVLIVHREYPQGGGLLEMDGLEGYGRVIIKKNDEDPFVLKR